MLMLSQILTTAVFEIEDAGLYANDFNTLIDYCTDIQAELNEYFANGDSINELMGKVVIEKHVSDLLEKMVEESLRMFPATLTPMNDYTQFIQVVTYTLLHELWTPFSKYAFVLQSLKLVKIADKRTDSVGASKFSAVPGQSKIEGSTNGWIAKETHNLFLDKAEITTSRAYKKYQQYRNEIFFLIEEPAFHINIIKIPMLVPTYHQMDVSKLKLEDRVMYDLFEELRQEVVTFIENRRSIHFATIARQEREASRDKVEDDVYQIDAREDNDDSDMVKLDANFATQKVQNFFKMMLEVYKG